MAEPLVDLKKPAESAAKQEAKPEEKGLSDDTYVGSLDLYRRNSETSRRITKYTSAGQAVAEVLKKLIPQIVAGKKVLDLCME